MAKFNCTYVETHSAARTIEAADWEDAYAKMEEIVWSGALEDEMRVDDSEIYCEEIPIHDFLDDNEKMADFMTMNTDEFLASYSYLTIEEYQLTYDKLMALIKGRKEG